MNFPEEPIHLKESGATILSRTEYDRLLAVEGEYQRLRAILDDQAKLLELMVRYPKLISNGEHKPECTCLVCRARAAIVRAKGGE